MKTKMAGMLTVVLAGCGAASDDAPPLPMEWQGSRSEECRPDTCSPDEDPDPSDFTVTLTLYIQNNALESRLCKLTLSPGYNPKLLLSSALASGAYGVIRNAKASTSWFAVDVQGRCGPMSNPAAYTSKTVTIYAYAHDSCRFTYYEPPAPASPYFDVGCWTTPALGL